MLRKLIPIGILIFLAGICIPFVSDWQAGQWQTAFGLGAVGIAFLVAILLYQKNPALLLLIILPAMIFGQIYSLKIRDWFYEISLSEILIILLTIFVLVDQVISQKGKRIKFPLLVVFFLFYIGLACVSVGWGQSISRAIIAIRILGFHLLTLILSLNLIRTRKDFELALAALPLTGFLVSTQLIYHVYQMGGFLNAQPLAREAIITPVGKWVYVAAVIILTIPTTYALLLKSTNKWLRGLLALVIIFGLVATTLTLGKGEILAILIGLAYFLTKQKSQRRVGLIILALFLIIALIPLATYGQKFAERLLNTFQDPNTNFRLAELKVALGLFLQKPILGLGIGNLKLEYKNLLPWSVESESNNLILQIGLELGLLGLGIVFLIGLQIAKIFKRMRANIIREEDHFLYLGFATTLLVVILNAMVEVTLIGLHYGIVFWYITGLIIAYPYIQKNLLRQNPSPSRSQD